MKSSQEANETESKPTSPSFGQRLHNWISNGDGLASIPYKVTFFAVYASFGSMVPFLPLYFKQLGFNAAQTGILVAIRPFMQAIGAPGAGWLADKFRRRKLVLLIAVLAFAGKYLLTMAVQPQHQYCIKTPLNITNNNETRKMEVKRSVDGFNSKANIAETRIRKTQVLISQDNVVAQYTLNDQSFYNYTEFQNRDENITNSKANYAGLKWNVDRSELETMFILIMLIVIIGEVIASSLQPLCDASVVAWLKERRDYYGRVRLWGAIGMATSTLVIGAVISQHTAIVCGILRKHYLIAFYFALGFQLIAFLAILVTRQEYEEPAKIKRTGSVRNLFIGYKITPFWIVVVSFGILDGFQMDFGSWFMDELGASSFMIGLATGLHFALNACTFLVANYALGVLGYMNQLSLGMVLMAAVFVMFSFASSAWMAVLLYSVVGSVTCLVWSSAVAYVGLISAPLDLLSTAQGFLNGLYTGVGIASGTVLGGIIIKYISVRAAFRVYAGLAIVVMVIFNLMLWIGRRRDKSYAPLPTDTDDNQCLADSYTPLSTDTDDPLDE